MAVRSPSSPARAMFARTRFRSRIPSDFSDLDAVSATSHQPEVQSLIRNGIKDGLIRVVPIPGSSGRVRVLPVASLPPRIS